MKIAKQLLTKKREQLRFQVRDQELKKIFNTNRHRCLIQQLQEVIEVEESLSIETEKDSLNDYQQQNKDNFKENNSSNQQVSSTEEIDTFSYKPTPPSTYKPQIAQFLRYQVQPPPLKQIPPLNQYKQLLPLNEPQQSIKRVVQKQIVGRKYAYFLNNMLGEGANGKVYKGFEISDPSNEVAVKKISLKYLSKERVLREIAIQESLDSPFVVKLINYFFDFDSCYLILELCEGGSLAEKVRVQQIPCSQGIIYFQQILKAMKFFRDRQIIHRDLKLENILLKNNQVKLADFGFARTIKHLSCFSYKCGTPATMAPELLKASDHCRVEYTQKQDVWALGIILHELVYGLHPFANDLNRLMSNQRITISQPKQLVESFLKGSLEIIQERRMTLDECLQHQINQTIEERNFFQKTNQIEKVNFGVAGEIGDENNQEQDKMQNMLSGVVVIGGLASLFLYYIYFLVMRLIRV